MFILTWGAYLDHEFLDDTVKNRALVVKRLARLADTLLTSAKAAEVLGRLGNEVGVQLHDNAARRFAANGDVEEDAGSLGALGFRCHFDRVEYSGG